MFEMIPDAQSVYDQIEALRKSGTATSSEYLGYGYDILDMYVSDQAPLHDA
jgi:hypothetical protein